MVEGDTKSVMDELERQQCRNAPSPATGPEEVECEDCALDPMCQILDYNEGDNPPPEGILLRRQAVRRGETLFRAGDPFRSVFAVKSGSFKTLILLEGGRERVIGLHLPGELIGAEALSTGHYSCTARALETGSVCELRTGRLSDSGRSVEVMQRGIIELLGREVAFRHLLSSSLIRQSGEQRLAAFLLNLSERLMARGAGGVEFTINMSRSDIASYLGLATETVSRLLTKFQKAGILGIRHKRVRIKEREQLERIAAAEGAGLQRR